MRRSLKSLRLFAAVVALVCATVAAAEEAAPLDRIVHDWLTQDHGPDVAACFCGEDDASVEIKMLEKVLEELGEAGEDFGKRRDLLVTTDAPGKDPAWKELYVAACRARREARLKTLLAQTPTIVFKPLSAAIAGMSSFPSVHEKVRSH